MNNADIVKIVTKRVLYDFSKEHFPNRPNVFLNSTFSVLAKNIVDTTFICYKEDVAAVLTSARLKDLFLTYGLDDIKVYINYAPEINECGVFVGWEDNEVDWAKVIVLGKLHELEYIKDIKVER